MTVGIRLSRNGLVNRSEFLVLAREDLGQRGKKNARHGVCRAR